MMTFIQNKFVKSRCFQVPVACSHTLTFLLFSYLSFKLIVEVWVIELDEAEEQGPLLGDGVVLRNLLLHVLLQEGHVAEEASCEGPQQLEQQLDL